MKICILTHTMPRYKNDSNSASFIAELSEGLSKQHHEVIVLTPFDTLFKRYKRPFRVITYKYVWPDKFHTSGYSRVLKGDKKIKPQMFILSTLMSISALYHLIVLCRREKIDIVSAHWAIPNGVIACFASIITGTPYTVTIPGSDVYLGTKSKLFGFAMWVACRNARAVISDSSHYLAQLKSLGIKPRQTAVIRYGVNTQILKPLRKSSLLLKQLGINRSHKVIASVGRFVEKKGFIYLIEAMPKILKRYPKSILMLVGDGDLREKFHETITRLRIEKSVVFPGSVAHSRLPLYYNLSDIFVMPSVKDSSGNVDASPVAMMDAMSCGVPVVATKYSGSREIAVEGLTGALVKEKSSDEIALAVIRLIKLGDKAKLGKNVRKLAKENFSLEATARAYSDILRQFV